MITLMTIIAGFTAISFVVSAMGFVIRVFGKAIGFVLGLALLIPVLGVFLVGAGIVFFPLFLLLGVALTGARRIAHM